MNQIQIPSGAVEAAKDLWFEEYIYTSALSQNMLPKVGEFLYVNGHMNVKVSLVRSQPDAKRICWLRFYDENGSPHATNSEIPVPPQSNHLKLSLSYGSEQNRSESHNSINIIVSRLRLFFGLPVANELIWHHQYDETSAERRFLSPIGYHSLLEAQHINDFPSGEIVQSISAEAATLLSKAFEQRFPQEQFILLWLAFEALINGIAPGESNGSKRQRYFKETLQSEIANDEVYRLFKLRSELFKEGKVDAQECGEACWSLYMAIQVVILNPGTLRTGLVMGYESYIRQRVDTPTS